MSHIFSIKEDVWYVIDKDGLSYATFRDRESRFSCALWV